MPGASGGAPDPVAPVALSGPERSVLELLRSARDLPLEEEDLAGRLGLGLDTVRGSLQRLRSKHLAVVDEASTSARELTARGKEALEHGLPERRFVEALRSHGGALTPEEATAAGIADEERSAAIGILRRRGLLEEGLPFRLRPGVLDASRRLPEEIVLQQVGSREEGIDDAIFVVLERRGLVRVVHHSIKRWSPSDEGRQLPLAAPGASELGALTPTVLAAGEWRSRPFRAYDVRAPVPFVTGVRPNPYVAWLEEFEDLLIGLGFEQAEGPLLETEFWNNDVLFMPQDHPARTIHDAFSVEDVAGRPPSPELLARVAAVHEGRPMPGESTALGPGWPGRYDPTVAARPILRSQTTAVSARCLARRPAPPFRRFSLDRNFRPDSVDATHHVEFTQCEGIIGEEGLSLRHLIGVFRELAEGIGIRELKVRPSYFPFTEPSIEGYVRHPKLGWTEIFPGGVLRPEVTRPLGLDVPVIAWGIGVMRLAMVALGINDIRELFGDDLADLRGGGS